MNIGFIGLGKLGLPVALAMESKGHSVLGYDINPQLDEILKTKQYPHREPRVNELLQTSQIQNVSLDKLVEHSEIIFVAVQTPHELEYDGTHRLPDTRVDFDYCYLREAIKNVYHAMKSVGKFPPLAIISTVLPGTISREVLPIVEGKVKVIYNPSFIAQTTVIEDFLHPEFVLIGHNSNTTDVVSTIASFYRTLHSSRHVYVSIESAEVIKTAYNTWIGQKLATINLLGEVCHKIPGANIDDVSRALCLATDRLVSTKYMKAGMADAGPCHPRDNIAMSWLARRLNLSYDLFDSIMRAREKQTEWLADLICCWRTATNLPISILGKAYKPECSLVDGSPALLLARILRERKIDFDHWDPYVDGPRRIPETGSVDFQPRLYFIATKHEYFNSQYMFPKGSKIIDPFRYISQSSLVEIIKVGVGACIA